MLQLIISFFSPIVSFFIFMTGSSLLTTLLGLIFQERGISYYWTASLTCAYYIGYVFSSIHVERFISRVGFIRAHATFAALTTLSTMLHVFFYSPMSWVILRFSFGVGLAGLCLTTQNWFLNSASGPSARGRMLAVYMITMYASQSLGQYFLKYMDINTILPFCFVACFTSVCIMPVSMTKISAPVCEQHSIFGPITVFKISPSAAIGSLTGGILLGSVYGIMPIMLHDWAYSLREISLIMTVVVIGGMMLQYPIGKLSDKFERRKVLLVTAILSLIVTILLLILHEVNSFNSFLALTLIWGGLLFTIHPLSINLACDRVGAKDLLATTGGLMVSYSIGASFGPFFSALFMNLFGPIGMYTLFIILLASLSLFIVHRIGKREGIDISDQKSFTSLPSSGFGITVSKLFAKIKKHQ